MKTDARSGDPEVRALLEEVASDPRSALLRVAPESLGRIGEERSPPISAATLRTAAERHIVQVYREEVAQRLYEACLMKVTAAGPRSRLSLYRTKKKIEVPAEATWRRHAEQDVARHRAANELAEERRVLERAVAIPPSNPPSATEFAAASLRLVPADRTRVLLALALRHDRAPLAALRALDNVIANRPADLLASVAWANRGMVCAEMGDVPEAATAYRRGAEGLETLVYACISWLEAALQLGDRAGAVAAIERISAEVAFDHPALVEERSIHACDRDTNAWSPSRLYRELSSELADQLPEHVRWIVDE